MTNAVLAALDLRNQTATEPHALLLAYLRDKELLLVVTTASTCSKPPPGC